MHRSLVLRDLLLDVDKTLKVLAILEYGFLWRHLKAKNSTWLVTELANQRALKALFICVVYMYTPRLRWKGFSISATSKKPIGTMNLKLFLYELFQWYSHANKIQLLKKAFAFSLVLKVRVFVTQNDLLLGRQQRTKNTTAKRLHIFRVEHFRSNLRSHFPGKVSRARLHSLCSMRFVVLKLLLWITRQRSLKYLVH